MSKSNITIIGLGWLGLPLYYYLSELGFSCVGTTTSKEKYNLLKNKGVAVTQIELKEASVVGPISEFLDHSEVLIINIPPGLRRNPKSNYLAKIEKLIPFIEKSTIKQVLYISSTSVFEDTIFFPRITNTTNPTALSKVGTQLRAVEETLLNNNNFNTTILRFSGLVDVERHPAKTLSKKDVVANPEAPVNLIHRNDCLGIISAIIEQKKWGEIFNASFPVHQTKQEYYEFTCQKMGLKSPNFSFLNPSKGKLIDGNSTAEALNYTYRYVV